MWLSVIQRIYLRKVGIYSVYSFKKLKVNQNADALFFAHEYDTDTYKVKYKTIHHYTNSNFLFEFWKSSFKQCWWMTMTTIKSFFNFIRTQFNKSQSKTLKRNRESNNKKEKKDNETKNKSKCKIKAYWRNNIKLNW